jgi:hypothetical protein
VIILTYYLTLIASANATAPLNSLRSKINNNNNNNGEINTEEDNRTIGRRTSSVAKKSIATDRN